MLNAGYLQRPKKTKIVILLGLLLLIFTWVVSLSVMYETKKIHKVFREFHTTLFRNVRKRIYINISLPKFVQIECILKFNRTFPIKLNMTALDHRGLIVFSKSYENTANPLFYKISINDDIKVIELELVSSKDMKLKGSLLIEYIVSPESFLFYDLIIIFTGIIGLILVFYGTLGYFLSKPYQRVRKKSSSIK